VEGRCKPISKDTSKDTGKVEYGPPNDAKTERMLDRWDARGELVDKVRDWLGR
jgi:hypothetical protein